jgi:hypothetical protein
VSPRQQRTEQRPAAPAPKSPARQVEVKRVQSTRDQTPAAQTSSAQTSSAQTSSVQPQSVQQPSVQRAASPATAKRVEVRTTTGDFERLMRQNTVDVSRLSGRTRRRSPLAGKIALGLAVVSVAVDASAFAVFMGGDQTFALGICFVVVFLSFAAAVLGFISAVGGFGRWYGVFGVLLAFAGNPVILIVVLVFVAPEMATDFGA